ncbi:isocitrate lyase/phosphoenolpyruvate mutase family protein [Streptomyces sp. L500]
MTTVIGQRPSDRLRGALEKAAGAGKPVQAIGAANAMAARIAADSRFDALWVSGLEVSTAFGLPDENVLGSRDLADVVLSLRRVCDLPVVVDIDNAGGSAATARRYAFELAAAGAAAVCLEDSAYPKCNSFSEHRAQGLADADLACAQIKEIKAASAGGVLLIARTETLICGGTLDEAVLRAEAYQAAGADAILVHSKDTTGSQAMATAQRWNGVPLVTVPTAFAHLSQAVLGQAGFAMAIYANQLSRAAMTAMRSAADSFRTTGMFRPDALADVQDLLRVSDPDARACL